MKSKLHFILLICLTGINILLKAQWEPIGRITNESINKMFYISDSNIWAVGKSGLIIHYNGTNWEKITLPFLFEAELTAVFFTDANNGFVAGADGNLLRYQNGNWSFLVNSNVSDNINDIFLNSNNKGWFVGRNGYYYNGSTFTSFTFPGGGAYIYDIDFINDSMGWAVGYRMNDYKQAIYKYKNSAWILDTILGNGIIYNIDMLSDTEGWATADEGVIYRYNGSRWERRIVDSIYHFGLRKVVFTNSNNGWVIGYGYVNYQYSNGQWTANYITDIFSDLILGNSKIMASATSGNIYMFEQNEWKPLFADFSGFKNIQVVDQNNVWIINNRGFYKYKNRTLIPDTLLGYYSIQDAFFVDSTTGFAVGYGKYWKYKNGRWKQIYFDSKLGYPNLTSLYFVDSTLGWAVGNGGVILKYRNGIWSRETSPTTNNLTSVWFTSSTSGWAVGESGTLLKYTSGKWVLQPKLTNNHLYSVCFSGSENGWAVGERQTILQYKNQKWQIFSSTTYGDYYRKVTRTHGKWYITGSNGIILQWNDSIWDNLPINSKQEFLAIAFIDSLNGIAVSSNGLFETLTGGAPPYQHKTSLELLGNYYHSLVLSNDTIKILSNVRIDGSLKLKKSVKVVEFQGPYILQISGPLNAEGTLMQPIKFTVADSIISGSNKKWYNISMSANDANTWSTLKYCEFMHSDYGISVYHGKLNISNSKFTDCSTALYALNITEGQILNNEFNKITYNVLTINQSNKLVIENNLFTDNNANNCIQVNASSNIIFNKNIFTRNSGFRLLWFENSDVTLQLSKICNNEAGIMVNNGKLLINNCLIANNKYQQFYESPYNVGVIIANNCQLDILNSTIVNNKYPYSGNPGAALVYRFSGGNVYNSILWNNYIFDNDSSSLQPYQVYIYNNTSRPNFYSSNIQGGLNYFKKNTGVNFYGKYENNHSNNPLFINPTTGIGNDTGIIYDAMQANWQLQDNSTNINRGTLELGLLKLPDIDLKNQKRVQNGVVDIGAYENKVKPIEITSCDTIKNHTLWATDTVRIKNCNVVIASTGILSIKPGTRVEFWGPYKIIVQGVIRAIGTDKEPVIFTVHDTTGFVNTNVGGWKGIEFDNSTGVLDDKDSSIFKYCKFQYAKDTVGLYYIGMGIYGVIKAKYFSKLSITNSVFENNLAPFDSLNYTSAAVINIRNAKTIRIEKNMFVNNTGCLLKTEYAGLIFADNVIYKNKSMRRQNLLSIYSSEGNFYKNFFANNRSEIVNYNSLINFSGSNANFSNNVIVNNLDTGSGTVYSRYLMIIYGGRVQFHANTMANNSGVSYFYGLALKARNNIIWDDWVYAYGLEAGSYIQNNILKNASQYSYYDYYTSNIDKDPLFISPSSISGIASDGLSANWQLSYYSPAINSGTSDTTGMQIPRLDMAGNKRINGDAMDMGAYEHTGSKVQFVINPLGGNYCSGDSIVLVCKVNNEAKLQWQKDGVDIPSANDSILVLANLNELNSGNYVCKATNAYGTTFSPPAFIQVAVAPEVLTQPSTQWLSENQNEMITVTSTGTKPMKYYWYFRNNLIDSTLNGKLNIINASVNHEGTYYCRITNYCGSVETQPFGVYIKPQICLVTADTETGKNVVVWERKNGRKIKGYNIYRESMVRDIYEKLGFVNYLSPGVFVDSTSKPESRQYLYKIAVVSENDEVSPLSPYHKTLFLQYVSSVEGVNLMWQPYVIENGDVEFKSYVLFKGTDSTRLTPFDTVSSNITAYTDKDPLALNRLTFYRVAGLLYNACHSETLLKAGGGPFVEVLSNIEDNRLRSTGGGGGGTTIANINTSSFLSIYPQPASDVIKLSLTLEKSSSVQWEITNLTGTKVAFRSAGVLLQGNRELVINVSNIPSGTYLIKLQTNTNTWVDRIIIAR